MGLSKKAYKGRRDFFPTDKRKLEYIFSKMKQISESFSFEPYDGPLLEPVDLYLAKSGEEIINEQLYSFTDKGDRFVAIRPEMTPTLARMVAQIHKEVTKPIRWFSIPNLMRYEKPQRGRLREHWQFNCDIFGAPENFGEIEILQLIIELLTSFGASSHQFSIFINDRKFIDQFFNIVLKLNNELSYKLYKIIDKSKKVSEEALNKMLLEDFTENQALIIKKYLALKNFEDLHHFCQEYQLEESIKSLKTIFNTLDELNLSNFFSYDPSIVRDCHSFPLHKWLFYYQDEDQKLQKQFPCNNQDLLQ